MSTSRWCHPWPPGGGPAECPGHTGQAGPAGAWIPGARPSVGLCQPAVSGYYLKAPWENSWAAPTHPHPAVGAGKGVLHTPPNSLKPGEQVADSDSRQ